LSKKYWIIFLVFLVISLSTLPVNTYAKSSGGGYSHPQPQGLKPGDIILGYNPNSWWIPGYWSHAGMIIGWSGEYNDWLVIEALADGVQVNTLTDFMSRYPDIVILRVNTTDQIRIQAVFFALQQLGKGYDYFWWTKHVYGSRYYCSELVWASYKAVGGPDIDANPGFSWKYLWGVAPQEIYDDPDTYVIYRHHV
jgi:uncharacterized protein YycO